MTTTTTTTFETASFIVSYYDSYEEQCEWILSGRPEGTVIVDVVHTGEEDEYLDRDEYIVEVTFAPSEVECLKAWAEMGGARFIPAAEAA